MHYLQLSFPIQLLFFTISFYVNISFYVVILRGFKALKAMQKQLLHKVLYRKKSKAQVIYLSYSTTGLLAAMATSYLAPLEKLG